MGFFEAFKKIGEIAVILATIDEDLTEIKEEQKRLDDKIEKMTERLLTLCTAYREK